MHRDIHDLVDSLQARIWVAIEGLRPVGFVGLRLDSDGDNAEMDLLAVDPPRNHGIAFCLIATAEDHARHAGMTMMTILTSGDPAHLAARRVYERRGYTVRSEQGHFRQSDSGRRVVARPSEALWRTSVPSSSVVTNLGT